MKIIALMGVLLICGGLLGCGATPTSRSMASARIRVVAKPRAGAVEPIARVATYDSAPAPAKPSGTFEHVDYASLDNIVLWIEAPAGTVETTRPADKAIDVNADQPSSKILPVSRRQTVRVRNSSSHTVSLYSVSDGNEFDLPSIRPGESATFAAKSEGLIEILADPAKPPVALVYVAPSAHVAVARSGETIVFRDIPPGDGRLVTWHPRLPGSDRPLPLIAGRVSNVTITIGVNTISDSSR
ncbi:hypothetical protein BH09PLA1_BH09PLA1_15660 [soil metagenome]